MFSHFTKLFLFFFIIPLQFSYAANLPLLKKLFTENYNLYYQPRLCGKNTARFVSEANKRNIDLKNSFILKIEGAGFLETSAFYARGKINERQMLGYFHVIFVADNYVFDFDLDGPKVLKFEEYIRLQFTPPYEPFTIYGINYRSKEQLPYWTATRFEWGEYIRGNEIKTWEKSFSALMNIDEILKLKR